MSSTLSDPWLFSFLRSDKPKSCHVNMIITRVADEAEVFLLSPLLRLMKSTILHFSSDVLWTFEKLSLLFPV